MVKFMLCGCQGKMGHVIEECSLTRGDCQVVAGVDLDTDTKRDFPVFKSPLECTEAVDAVIDFSHPSTLDALLEYGLSRRVPLVIATTGYSDTQISRIHEAAKQIPIFFTFNMSLGVNLLAELARKATAVLGGQFDIEIVEKHHNRKVDAPSGTALMLANTINETLGNKDVFVYDRHSVRKKRDPNEIGIHSVRGGTIVGEHEIIFAGRDEILALTHTAMSREIFAVGALNAAIFMAGCHEAGLYDMSDLIRTE